ncbi:MAG TPA: hypothetical protein PLL30_09570 [Candidatus Krumholzibacteria bacterium]|nr:hypothetical protein [Candidatus Krumholzibacteria bacterium]HPD72011.1 hypothetical protein [Candidatus Krumholzibacteria bacterium]HRY41056.1 hypothetical protein [Candidatus Krumholzibacteria bacterium]
MPNRLPAINRLCALPVVTGLGGAGRRFRRAVREVERLEPAALAAWQLARLNALLAHAVRAPGHRDRLAAAGCLPGSLRSLDDLARLPLLEKADLADAPAATWLTRRPRWRHTVRTSGTTGRPLTLQLDFAWWARSLARRQILFARHGLRYGDREGRFWGRANGTRGPTIRDRLGNRLTFQFMGETANELAAEARALREFAPSYLYGYPSLVRQAARAWIELGLPPLPGLRGIVLTAERVSAHDLRTLADAFGCPVHREYGCSEADILAFDCEHGACHVASDHVIVEALDPCDGLGECVVTDLDNTLMPLVRYRLGDRIRFAAGPCACGRTTPVIAAIEGRTGDARYLYLPDGRRVHTVLFAYLFEDLAAGGVPVRQFKVRQTERDRVVVHLDTGDRVPPPGLAATIADAVRTRVGHRLAVEVAFGKIDRVPGTKWNYFDPLPPHLRPAGRTADRPADQPAD